MLSGKATFAADTSAMEKVHGLRTLAVAAEERVADLLDVPTLKELGKDVVVTIWSGAFAPAGTPADVLGTLSAACGEAVKDEEFLAGMAKANCMVSYKDRAAFQDYFDTQYEGAGEFLEVIGVKSK